MENQSNQDKVICLLAVSGVIYMILDKDNLSSLPNHSKRLCQYAEKCTSVLYHLRPNSKQVLKYFELSEIISLNCITSLLAIDIDM